jgi:predicted hydrocarbon binding protein
VRAAGVGTPREKAWTLSGGIRRPWFGLGERGLFMVAHVKGIVLKTRLDYVEKTFGERACSRVIASLSPEGRAALEHGVLISSWYPVSLSVEMLLAIDRLFGKDDLELIRTMGNHSARIGLSSVYESFGKKRNAHFANRMTPVMWKQYYDAGEMQVEAVGEGKAIVRIRDFPEPHRALCMGTLGWLEAANKIWGVQGAQVKETKCRTLGESYCEFVVEKKGRKAS